MLEVVDGPSVQDLQSVLFNFNYLLLSVFYLFFYLQLTVLSAESKDRREYHRKRRSFYEKNTVTQIPTNLKSDDDEVF